MATVTLRPYQDILVSDIRAAYNAGHGSVLAVAPTGAGKTLVFSFIAHAAAKLGTRICVLAHRETLIRQTSAALTLWGVPHGIIAPGHSATRDLVQVASVQTLARRLGRYQFDLLVADEGHHATAGTWRKILADNPVALLLGVSATPCRTDGKGLDDVYEVMVSGPSSAWLIAEGYLVAPLTYAPANPLDLSRVHMRGGDYDKKELAAAVDTPRVVGDAVAHYLRLAPGRTAAAFAVSVQHAQDIAASFLAAGVPSEAVHGGMKYKDIALALERLAERRTLVLASCDLVSEGFDCPGLEAVVGMRPTKSEALYVQQGGRALRPVYAPGFDLASREGRLAAIAASPKPRALILDHAGNCLRHGMLDEEREWSLQGRPKKKGAAVATVPVRQCPRCFVCHRPAPKCPECGYIYEAAPREVQQVAGELVQADPEEVRRLRRYKVSAARTLADLERVGEELGYRPGWASILWTKRGGNAGAARRARDLVEKGKAEQRERARQARYKF